MPSDFSVRGGVPVRRVRRVSVLGGGELAELIIDAPVPTGALIDVIAIELDGRLD